jgi:pimeloyl-ACP methyl ester carboxylesterase
VAGVVLVHGAWHGAWCWDGVVGALERHGVAATAVELPFTGFDDDVEATRKAIEAAGPGSVVVAHSYGGFVASTAAAGRSDVGRLVYVAAFAADAGEDARTILTTYRSPLLEAIAFTDDGLTVDPDRARDVFYGDSDQPTAAGLVARLRPMPLEPMGQQSEPAWRSIASTYVVCTNDRAVPVEAQRWMAERATEVVELPCDHSPFVTRPAELAAVIATYLD